MLRDAIRVIHADKYWWKAVGIAGLCATTLIGYPIAAGLVIEHLDNTRKGYDRPLPPFVDWSTRWLIGFFAVLIEFVFYVMPTLVACLLFFCFGLTMVVQQRVGDVMVLWTFGGILLAWWLFMFLCGVSPIARLIYVDDSGTERSMGGMPIREAFRPGARGHYAAARLQSIPLYIIPALLLLAIPLVIDLGGVIAWLLGPLVIWLFWSSLVYAHLVIMQLYHRVDLRLEAAQLMRTPYEGV
jgi:hypothetical protein